jgi:hypothetical protein
LSLPDKMSLPPTIFLTAEEVERLVLLRVYAAGKAGRVSTPEIHDVISWAEKARIANAMVDAVLSGDALPVGCAEPGKPDTMQVKLTPKGEASGEKLLAKALKGQAPA